MKALPIFSGPYNREIVGFATTTGQAKNILKGLLQTIPKGWTIDVQSRDTSIIDGPSGWIYSVHP
jgi:hypothetical protein